MVFEPHRNIGNQIAMCYTYVVYVAMWFKLYQIDFKLISLPEVLIPIDNRYD